MKLYKISLALLLGVATLSSCEDKLDVDNPNTQTSATFGHTVEDLEEMVIAAYHNIRMEGSYARVGYTIDVCRGDEVWNSSQVWYMPFDDLNVASTDDINSWPWREWYYTINVCNMITSYIEQDYSETELPESVKRIKGQALFIRGLAYYNLAGYYQNPCLVSDFSMYGRLEDLYWENSDYDSVLDQCETDFSEAMTLLPARSAGGEWAKGRATCGSAAGYYARVLMQRHKYSEALTVLRDIIGGEKYGAYRLMDNYGDNFREGSAYENNDESLFEVQFLDYGTQGPDDEWTPVNVSPNSSQGHAVESNYAPGDAGGWADLSASPWLYNLFKAERTTGNSLDPRLYWTIGTYEPEWASFEYGNVAYTNDIKADKKAVNGRDTIALMTNNTNGGLPIAKWTNMRTGLYNSVTAGLKCGINLRLMRYSDVLLRAAECINEIDGPTAEAIEYINQVRRRAKLADLQLSDFQNNADKLFEQIANVERPKEFGCEFGRGLDLIRWGFFYNTDRLNQLKEHGTFRKSLYDAKAPVSNSNISTDSELKSSYDTYSPGHEFLPIPSGNMDDNPNLKGNSANYNTSNAEYFNGKGWKIHPVVNLGN